MKPIRIENGIIVYYGNRVGTIKGERAIVDSMFDGMELNTFLKKQTNLQEIKWMDGVFERLANGQIDTGEMQILKKCRVWQLKPDVDIRMKFISYDELSKKFGLPNPKNYQIVFEGEVDTNNLEELYGKFNIDHPPSYQGHSLSISDVIELYDEMGSSFHYVDHFGFKQIAFKVDSQNIEQSMQF